MDAFARNWNRVHNKHTLKTCVKWTAYELKYTAGAHEIYEASRRFHRRT